MSRARLCKPRSHDWVFTDALVGGLPEAGGPAYSLLWRTCTACGAVLELGGYLDVARAEFEVLTCLLIHPDGHWQTVPLGG